MTRPKLTEIVKDVYEVLTGDKPVGNLDHLAEHFGHQMADLIKTRVQENRGRPRIEDKVLRMSAAGKPCLRQLWYSFRDVPREPLAPHTLMKFLFGDVIEQLVILLLRAAGHIVTEEQQRCRIDLPNGWTVLGHKDCRVDGQLTDVKSASTRQMEKFRTGDFGDDDFGYTTQLSLYGQSEGDTRAMWLAVDKQLGHIVRTPHKVEPVPEHVLVDVTSAIESDAEPPRPTTKSLEVAMGKSGNTKLCTMCSYCDFKQHCWRDSNGGAGLRTFLYGGGPVHLTKVVHTPKVPEAKHGGQSDRKGVDNQDTTPTDG